MYVCVRMYVCTYVQLYRLSFNLFYVESVEDFPVNYLERLLRHPNLKGQRQNSHNDTIETMKKWA